MPPPRSLAFYMYEEPALNHHWLRHCAKFKDLRAASKAENTAEVGLHKVLRHHPLRTRDAARARLFYVPVFEYASKFVAASCANATATPAHLADHALRMLAARSALLASPHWRVHGGRDHIWATSAFSAHGYTLQKRMAPLSSMLSCSAVGRYKAGPFGRGSAGGACVVEVPYQASLHVMRAWLARTVGGGAEGGGGGGGGAKHHHHHHHHHLMRHVAISGERAAAPPPRMLSAGDSDGGGGRGGGGSGGGSGVGSSELASRGDVAPALRVGVSIGREHDGRLEKHGREHGGVEKPTVEEPRNTLLFFAGSLDVCCTGRVLRCAIADLTLPPLGRPT